MGQGAMDPERWARAAELFEAAVARPMGERQDWLELETAGDPGMRELVRRMLDADAGTGDVLALGIAPAAHLALEEEVRLAPGTRVGAFDVVGELGRGGMGIVYAAVDRHLGRPAALKFLPVTRSGMSNATSGLVAEAKAASALDHPNVATVYQVAETDEGRQFIAMARYDGETLRERVARGRIPLDEALRIARETAAGLAAAHRAGIVHRDVSAANIFLTRDGSVRLLDFGIAALAGSDPVAEVPAGGTLSSMSPEQARGEPAGARSDVWALGAVLYRMLTGEPPFAAADPVEQLRLIRGDAAPPRLTGRRDVPRRVARVVDRALSRDPAGRYRDAGELLEALERASAPRAARRGLAVVLVMLSATLGAGALALVNPGAESPGIRGAAIAVLPAVIGDSANAYLAEGVLDELAARLSRLRRLRVKGPRAAAAARARQSSRAIGDALGVEYLLRSRIRTLDSTVQISLTLVEAEAGFQLWAADYHGTTADLLRLQDSIAREVGAAVAGELSERDRATLGGGVTSSPLAYDRFLRGNYLLGKRTPTSVSEAIREYRVAVEHDAEFAEAIARMAYAYLLVADWGWQPPDTGAPEPMAAAEALLRRAEAIAPGSAEVLLAQAYARVLRDPRHHAGAIPLFVRSLGRDSLNAEAFHQYGQTLMALGRYREARAAYLRALELDPARPMTLVPLAAITLQEGDHRAALAWADSAVAVTRLVPAPYALAVRASVRLTTGDVTGALADARNALALDSSYPVPALAVAAGALDRLGDARSRDSVLARLRSEVDSGAPSTTDARFAASTLFATGSEDDALRLIENARPRGALLWFYLQSRDFDPYRTLPRFRAVEAEADPRAPS